MNWYAAHVIMAVQLKSKRQTRFPVWENIVLIAAESEAAAGVPVALRYKERYRPLKKAVPTKEKKATGKRA